MTPRRGEFWWVRLDPALGSEIKKTRPCLVMGTNVLNERRRTVVLLPLSSAPQAAPPLLVPVVCAGRHVVAVLDQIRAVTKERLVRRMGEISPSDLTSMEEALRIILEL
jgi:mRNA interferase MazF